MEKIVIDVKHLVKRFPGVVALTDVSFQIRKNTVHCLVGENGAGKSTFIKILTGVYQADEGELLLNGSSHQPKNIRESRKAGITAIYQELNVVDDLTVEQNLSLGKENHRLGVVQKTAGLDQVAAILNELDPRIDLNQKVGTLSVAQKQVIEIAKAISSDANIIVMDEPTAAISEEEVRRLFEIVQSLKQQGVTIIYISHRLSEIFKIGDFVTVFRDGKMINTLPVEALSHNGQSQASVELVKMMLGKVVAAHYKPSKIDYQTKVLEVQNISNHALKQVSFDLHQGEILGFYGLVGSGKTETARVLYGLDPYEGKVLINGQESRLGSVRKAIKNGITMIPEERRADGIFGVLSIRENIPIMKMGNVLKNRIVSRIKERSLARSYMQKLRVVAINEEQSVSFLSGGNQQKVVISKCLNSESKIFLMDEPTRGVDVGAKEEIHNIIRDLSKEGCSIIVFSTELPEIINLCDRIILMYEGEIRKILKNHKDIDSEEIMHIITGGQGGAS
ncbi:MAG: sugar ABC transporter ATP-binding protein [Desulfobacterales bacterium]|jgi:ABC-type sugar transport system ATPase subunit